MQSWLLARDLFGSSGSLHTWKDAVFATWDFMDNSESSIAPRSRTTETGWTFRDPTGNERSKPAIFCQLDREPNIITSVLMVSSCSRREAHHVTPGCNVCHTTCHVTSDVSRLWTCKQLYIVSIGMFTLTNRRRVTLMSPVSAIKCSGPRTNPLGTLHVTGYAAVCLSI